MWALNESGNPWDSVRILIAKLDTNLNVEYETFFHVPPPQVMHTMHPLSDGRLHVVTKIDESFPPDYHNYRSHYSYIIAPGGTVSSGPTPFAVEESMTVSPNPTTGSLHVD